MVGSSLTQKVIQTGISRSERPHDVIGSASFNNVNMPPELRGEFIRCK